MFGSNTAVSTAKRGLVGLASKRGYISVSDDYVLYTFFADNAALLKLRPNSFINTIYFYLNIASQWVNKRASKNDCYLLYKF